jgi:hypothetical protein
MANPTNPFNWQMPTSTDLVTDLPADFEVFGQAVATSMADLLGGTTGQVLAKASNTDMDFSWVAQDDSNAIQNAIVDAKGDLIAASANDTPARLAVGNNGETLVADSSTSTGLRYQSNFAAGKNAIINGAFNVWQRGTSFTTSGYSADRFYWDCDGSTKTFAQQSFTPGTAPVAGYEGQYFGRGTKVAGTYAVLLQKIEDARTFAGQTVTVSFWAKAAANTTVDVYYSRNFGSGGSADDGGTVGTAALTTSWTRFSVTFAMPSVSGKTIGAGSFINLQPIRYVNAGNLTFDIWGLQLEASNTATAFQTATGTIQGELAACRRYLPAVNLSSGVGVNLGYAYGTNAALFVIPFDVVARTQPTGISIPTVSGNFTVRNSTNGDASATTMTFDVASVNNASVLTNGTLTAGTVARLITNAGGYILFTGCEL